MGRYSWIWGSNGRCRNRATWISRGVKWTSVHCEQMLSKLQASKSATTSLMRSETLYLLAKSAAQSRSRCALSTRITLQPRSARNTPSLPLPAAKSMQKRSSGGTCSSIRSIDSERNLFSFHSRREVVPVSTNCSGSSMERRKEIMGNAGRGEGNTVERRFIKDK